PDAVFDVPGAPDWIAVDDDVWISNAPKNNVVRLDPKTNQVAATIDVQHEPCSGLAAGFGSLWVPRAGESSHAGKPGKPAGKPGDAGDSGGASESSAAVESCVVRVDLLTNKITATIPI